MEVSVLADSKSDTGKLNSTLPLARLNTLRRAASVSAAEISFQLGLWLSSLQSFLQIRNYSFVEGGRAKASNRDWTKEFYLTNSAQLLCSKLSLQLLKLLEVQKSTMGDSENFTFREGTEDFSFKEVSDFAETLKNSILLNEALARAAPLSFSEWTAWCNSLGATLQNAAVVQKFIRHAETEGDRFLPSALHEILRNKAIPLAVEADLRIVLPRLGKILKWLSVVAEMLKKDEPLKPALLIFSRIYEQTQEMMKYINNRLLRFPDENDPIFGALDCAVYAASIESRKVYNFELAGLTEIRQTPLIYAKIETAYGLLSDSFQQTLVNFTQLIEPDVDPKKLFPNFQTKLEQSLNLRKNLWSIQQTARKAEHHPDTFPLGELHEKLNEFVGETMYYLMYKDCETIERFVEEILRTSNKKDLVPILHRFGAYVETLLGQVNMRVVLANYPFDYPPE